jgi:glycosyltransferase involved in cell wall biosynthesis
MHEMVSEKPHWVERWAARAVPDLAIVNSEVTARVLPRLYPRMWSEVVHCVVIPQPVDRSEARSAVRAELGTAAEDVVVVMACRLDRIKGHPLLLSALGRLRDRPGWTGWIAGGIQRPAEQRYLDEIQSQARDLGIDRRLRFLGERRDMPRLLAAADIHCQPNLQPETFGSACIEALYAGLPVVSTRMGGAAEIVTDECGVLTPPNDPGALAAALSTLIDDPATRARLGAAGPARAAELCAPEVVLPRLESLLLELHAARTAAGRGVPQPAA